MKPMHFALALSATLAVAGLALTANPAAAANSAMATCNKQWNDETAANTTNGVAYKDFLKQCLSKASAASTDPAAPAAATTTVAQADTADTTTAAPVDPAVAKAKKDCSAQYKAAKADGSLGTTKKKDFIDACLAKAGITPPPKTTKPKATATTTMTQPATTTTQPTQPAATTTAPVQPTTTMKPTTPKTTTASTTTDASGKPKTPGQLARDARIKQCGADWKAAKAAGTTNGETWPQFWSACDKKLKAAAAGGTTTQ